MLTPAARLALREATPGLLAAAAIGAAALASRRNLRLLTTLGPGGDVADGDDSGGVGGGIDVVVPARDEAAGIATCVGALACQGDGVTTIVVDDGSSDATAAIAAASGATVLGLTQPPPPGFTGKTNACWHGAGIGSAAWLAFVDADVRLAPGALAALVRHADASGLDAVSPLLRQRCSGIADALVVPLAYWQYSVGMAGLARVGAERGRRALLNGQCLLVRRFAYDDVGGHAAGAVRATPVEDAALARLLAASEHAVGMVGGEALGEVGMYASMGALRRGFLKNAGELVAAEPRRGLLVAATGVALAQTPRLLVAAVRRPTRGRLGGAAAAYSAGLVSLRPAHRAARTPAWALLAHPAGAVAMQLVAVESLLRLALRRPTRWKGRRPPLSTGGGRRGVGRRPC